MCNEVVKRGATRQCSRYGEKLWRENKVVDDRQKLEATNARLQEMARGQTSTIQTNTP